MINLTKGPTNTSNKKRFCDLFTGMLTLKTKTLQWSLLDTIVESMMIVGLFLSLQGLGFFKL